MFGIVHGSHLNARCHTERKADADFQSLRLVAVLLTLLCFYVTDAAHAIDSNASAPLIIEVEGSDTDPEQLSAQELRSLVAPIALYPDALLGDILTAATNSVHIVLAARYLKQHQGQIEKNAGTEWDISVRSLLHYPVVLNMMDQNLAWTNRLGEAVINQQKDVMAAIQEVRNQAHEAGNLNSNDKQKVVVEHNTITIIPASPRVIYVPVYDPYTVLLPSPVPVISFGVGLAVNGWFSFSFNWPHGYIYVHARPWHVHHPHYRYPRHHRYTWRPHKVHHTRHASHRLRYRSGHRSVHHRRHSTGALVAKRSGQRSLQPRRGRTAKGSRYRAVTHPRPQLQTRLRRQYYNSSSRVRSSQVSRSRATIRRWPSGGRSLARNRSAVTSRRNSYYGNRGRRNAGMFGRGHSLSRGALFNRGGTRRR